MTGYKRVLLKLSGEVFGGGRVGRRPRRRQRHRRGDRRRRPQRRPGRDRRRRRQLLPRRRAAAARHGPRPRRLHGHARHGDELPGPAGLPREARASRPGCRPRSRWARSPSPTSRGARSATSRRAGWSSSAPAPACRTSPPTRSPPSARWRSAPRCILMGKQGVDGVYDADPNRTASAVKFDQLTYDEFLHPRAQGRRRHVDQPLPRQRHRHDRVQPVRATGTSPASSQGEKIGTTITRDV